MTINTFQFAAQLTLSVALTEQGTTMIDAATAAYFAGLFQSATTLTDGTGTSKVDTVIFQPRVLAASANEELNLFDGSLLDVNNAATGLQTVKELTVWQIANADGTTAASSLTVGGSASNGLQLNFGNVNDTWTITLNGSVFNAGRAAGYTVDNTHKLLKITNNDGSNKASYLIVIGGNHI